jgi:hypothetical protein
VIMLNIAAQSQVARFRIRYCRNLAATMTCPSVWGGIASVGRSRTAFLTSAVCAMVDPDAENVSANRLSSTVITAVYYCGFLAVMM